MNRPAAFPSLAGRYGGFSLIELMVVVILLGILLAVAVPTFRDMVVQTRLATQSNDLLSAVQMARSEAVKRNQPVSLCAVASATATSCPATALTTWLHWLLIDGNDNILRRGAVSDSLKLTGPASALVFAPSGLSTVASYSLVLCSPTGSGDTTRTLEIGLSGRAAVSKSTGCS